MAAAALFVLLASLVWLICAVLLTELALIVTMSVFGGFFIVGLVFLAASAFINAEIVKAFLDATGPLRGVRP